MLTIPDICAAGPVIPVLVVERLADAAPLVRALVAGVTCPPELVNLKP